LVEHSASIEQASPWFLTEAQVVPAQYIPAPHELDVQLPEQSLPLHRLVSHFVVVAAGQTPLPSQSDWFVRTPAEQLWSEHVVELPG
jgi:hypothetical protein